MVGFRAIMSYNPQWVRLSWARRRVDHWYRVSPWVIFPVIRNARLLSHRTYHTEAALRGARQRGTVCGGVWRRVMARGGAGWRGAVWGVVRRREAAQGGVRQREAVWGSARQREAARSASRSKVSKERVARRGWKRGGWKGAAGPWINSRADINHIASPAVSSVNLQLIGNCCHRCVSKTSSLVRVAPRRARRAAPARNTTIRADLTSGCMYAHVRPRFREYLSRDVINCLRFQFN